MTLLIEAFLALIIYIVLSEVLNPTPPAPVQVSATLIADPNQIHVGESSLLTWTSKNAISAKLDTVVVPLQGSRTVSPKATTTYTLVVDGPGGPLAEVEVISVLPAPPPPPPPPGPLAVQISASSTNINVGMSVILSWTSQNAGKVTLDGLEVALNGQTTITPIATHTYTVVATDGGVAPATAGITITVVPAPIPGVGQHLTLINQSSVALDIAAYLAAQNKQLRGEFKSEWNIDAYIDLIPGGWPVYLIDVSDVAGALGYHDYDVSPYCRVFIKTSINDNVVWQTVASHEVLEMLVDPGPNFLTVKDANGDAWDKEVGDPVEDIVYFIDGVPLTDYADPSWFVSASAGKWDEQSNLQKDHQLTPGGYAVKNGQQVLGAAVHQKYGAAFVGVDGNYKKRQKPVAQPRTA